MKGRKEEGKAKKNNNKRKKKKGKSQSAFYLPPFHRSGFSPGNRARSGASAQRGRRREGRAPTGRPHPLPVRGGREGGREGWGSRPQPRSPPTVGGERAVGPAPSAPRAADVRAPTGAAHRERGALSGRAAPRRRERGCASLPAGGCWRWRRRKVWRRHGRNAAAEVTGAGWGKDARATAGSAETLGFFRSFSVFSPSRGVRRGDRSSVAVCPRRLRVEPSRVAVGFPIGEKDTRLCCGFAVEAPVGRGSSERGRFARVPPSAHLRWDAHDGEPGCAGADSSGNTPGEDRGGLGESGLLSKPPHAGRPEDGGWTGCVRRGLPHPCECSADGAVSLSPSPLAARAEQPPRR